MKIILTILFGCVVNMEFPEFNNSDGNILEKATLWRTCQVFWQPKYFFSVLAIFQLYYYNMTLAIKKYVHVVLSDLNCSLLNCVVKEWQLSVDVQERFQVLFNYLADVQDKYTLKANHHFQVRKETLSKLVCITMMRN